MSEKEAKMEELYRETRIQMLYYLMLKGKEKFDKSFDKISLLKLVFFADRYHLRKYVRSISQSEYRAMEKGPVASKVKELLDSESKYQEETEKYFVRNEDGKFNIQDKNIVCDALSESDKEALNFALNCFGNKTQDELVEFSHRYPEWKKFENSIEENNQEGKEMNFRDFFDDPNIEDDPFKTVPRETVDLSKDFYLGNF